MYTYVLLLGALTDIHEGKQELRACTTYSMWAYATDAEIGCWVGTRRLCWHNYEHNRCLKALSIMLA